jgi:hypothetical protein
MNKERKRTVTDNFNATTGLFLFRPLELDSARQVNEWMIENHIPNPVPIDELHCTIINSTIDIPSYVPGAEPVTVSSSTFQIAMLNNALAVTFVDSTLNEQHYRIIGMGATSEFPHFLPHISVSYQVPLGFSLEDIKPPSLPLTFSAEVRQHQNLDWKCNGAATDDMCYWLDQFGVHDFMAFLRNQGVTIHQHKVPLSRLIPTQRINEQRVSHLAAAPHRFLDIPYLISNDDKLFDADAHVRWRVLILKTPNCSVATFKADVSGARLKELYGEYAGT